MGKKWDDDEETCPTCGGEGTLYYPPDSDRPEGGVRICDTCGGTGVV